MNTGGTTTGIPNRFRNGRVGDVPPADDRDGDGVTSIGVLRRQRWIPANNANTAPLPSFSFGAHGAVVGPRV
jgi:hypothetical protein